jgi:hypothetical protein
MRGQLRLVVCVLVIVVLAVTAIIERPTPVETLGYVIVVAAMLAVIDRERKKAR